MCQMVYTYLQCVILLKGSWIFTTSLLNVHWMIGGGGKQLDVGMWHFGQKSIKHENQECKRKM